MEAFKISLPCCGFCAVAVLLAWTPAAVSVGEAERVQPPPAESPMKRLAKAFQGAGSPRERELLGKWALVRHVSTEQFLTGRDGPDHVLFDMAGIRREVQGEKRLEWTLTFARGNDGRINITSETVWVPTRDISPLTFNAEGDLLFEKEYGGDSKWIYRCRASSAQHLVCLLSGHESGHGVEFRKTAAQRAAAAREQRACST